MDTQVITGGIVVTLNAARAVMALDRTGLHAMAETPASFWRGVRYDS